MDYTLMAAAGVTLMAGPCVLGWIVGERMGSARTRRFYEDKARGSDTELCSPVAGEDPMQAEWIDEQVSAALHRQRHRAALIRPSSGQRDPDLLVQMPAENQLSSLSFTRV